MNFAELLRDEAKWTSTWNGADALNTTSNALLDMFGSLAAMRNRAPEEWLRQFELAWLKDPLGTLRCLFYVRDVRGGQGEREIFRTILHHAAIRHPEAIACNLPCIPYYGRWDDLYALIGTPLEEDMWHFMQAQLKQDQTDMAAGKPVSLLAKWLKKANSTNADTKKLGLYTAKKLGHTVYDYKRICSALRKYLDVTEVKMSAGEWDAIRYEKVPSRAMMIYREAFAGHDEGRFQKYLEAVEKGKTCIHSGTLYPYDIVEKILYKNSTSPVLESQWKALPDYVEGDANFLVMADVSGSMSGRPMASSIALAAYFAERNRGPYHNLFMTFSTEPQIVELQGDTIFDKVRFIRRADWDGSTNFEAAMNLVLKIAKKNKCRQADLPKAVICVTDMDFDQASAVNRDTYASNIQKMFAARRYKAPVLVFWNVHSTHDVFHGDKDSKGIVFVSGQSASTFRNLIRFINGKKTLKPEQFMYEVLNSERYQMVRLPA
jgi:hypothetical protein